jgi:hypothetical protein
MPLLLPAAPKIPFPTILSTVCIVTSGAGRRRFALRSVTVILGGKR